MSKVEIEIAGRRAEMELSAEDAARARALARRLDALAAPYADEPDRAAFFCRLVLLLAAEIDETTARLDEMVARLREDA
ncbi:MAG: hypothetical protein PVI23_11620 [Maricaulaceae bacterium]|jgi:cell division protein ZapA (FtsZ GTPase activity inhibitor)